MPVQSVVASKNPVKMDATLEGFKRVFPDGAFEVMGLDVPSGVRDQPMTSKETLEGATNRARAARKDAPHADFWIGIEGGVEPCHDRNNDNDNDDGEDAMEVFAWVVVLSRDGKKRGLSRTANFYLPREVVRLVMKDGMELGHADDRVFGRVNSKQQNGSVGLLTGDVITRREYYVHSVVLALIPFKNLDLDFPTPNTVTTLAY
jgi:inosine/xanthosine triphosphatase